MERPKHGHTSSSSNQSRHTNTIELHFSSSETGPSHQASSGIEIVKLPCSHPLAKAAFEKIYSQLWAQLLLKDGIVWRHYTPGPTSDAVTVPVLPLTSASTQSQLLQFIGPRNEQVAKQASFNVHAVISMLDDPMNDEELSDDEFGGYLSCEEMESRARRYQNRSSMSLLTTSFVMSVAHSSSQLTHSYTHLHPLHSYTHLHPPTSYTHLHSPTSYTHLHPPTSYTLLKLQHHMIHHKGLHALWIWLVNLCWNSFKLLINYEMLSSIVDQTNLYADQYICSNIVKSKSRASMEAGTS